MMDNADAAPAGRKVRAMLAIALVTAIVAGALFLPVMAGNDECKATCGHCAENFVPDTFFYWVCNIGGYDCFNPCPLPGPDPGMAI
jgi:hypothetical protein